MKIENSNLVNKSIASNMHNTINRSRNMQRNFENNDLLDDQNNFKNPETSRFSEKSSFSKIDEKLDKSISENKNNLLKPIANSRINASRNIRIGVEVQNSNIEKSIISNFNETNKNLENEKSKLNKTNSISYEGNFDNYECIDDKKNLVKSNKINDKSVNETIQDKSKISENIIGENKNNNTNINNKIPNKKLVNFDVENDNDLIIGDNAENQEEIYDDFEKGNNFNGNSKNDKSHVSNLILSKNSSFAKNKNIKFENANGNQNTLKKESFDSSQYSHKKINESSNSKKPNQSFNNVSIGKTENNFNTNTKNNNSLIKENLILTTGNLIDIKNIDSHPDMKISENISRIHHNKTENEEKNNSFYKKEKDSFQELEEKYETENQEIKESYINNKEKNNSNGNIPKNISKFENGNTFKDNSKNKTDLKINENKFSMSEYNNDDSRDKSNQIINLLTEKNNKNENYQTNSNNNKTHLKEDNMNNSQIDEEINFKKNKEQLSERLLNPATPPPEKNILEKNNITKINSFEQINTLPNKNDITNLKEISHVNNTQSNNINNFNIIFANENIDDFQKKYSKFYSQINAEQKIAFKLQDNVIDYIKGFNPKILTAIDLENNEIVANCMSCCMFCCCLCCLQLIFKIIEKRQKICWKIL